MIQVSVADFYLLTKIVKTITKFKSRKEKRLLDETVLQKDRGAVLPR